MRAVIASLLLTVSFVLSGCSTLTGTVVGAAVGSHHGPGGAAAGAVIGGLIGNQIDQAQGRVVQAHPAPVHQRMAPQPQYQVRTIRVIQVGEPQVVYHPSSLVLEVRSGTLCSGPRSNGYCIYAPVSRGGVQIHRWVWVESIPPQYHRYLQQRTIPAHRYRHDYHGGGYWRFDYRSELPCFEGVECVYAAMEEHEIVALQ